MTRVRAVEELSLTQIGAMFAFIDSMADQLAWHDFVFNKIESLCSTVQQHSESFEAIRKNNSESFDLLCTSLALQQAVMAKMMQEL